MTDRSDSISNTDLLTLAHGTARDNRRLRQDRAELISVLHEFMSVWSDDTINYEKRADALSERVSETLLAMGESIRGENE